MLIVDSANVVGSVPDGWWRDRVGATTRLRDHLASLDTAAVMAGAGAPTEDEVQTVLVVEGQARGVPATSAVAVIAASGSGDDAIVDIVAAHPDRRRVVVTADRELRRRVTELGAHVIGPGLVRNG